MASSWICVEASDTDGRFPVSVQLKSVSVNVCQFIQEISIEGTFI